MLNAWGHCNGSRELSTLACGSVLYPNTVTRTQHMNNLKMEMARNRVVAICQQKETSGSYKIALSPACLRFHDDSNGYNHLYSAREMTLPGNISVSRLVCQRACVCAMPSCCIFLPRISFQPRTVVSATSIIHAPR